MKVYVVRDWNLHFEVWQTRRAVDLKWLAVPNKHDGKGYGRVSSSPRAVEVFCAWNLILQVASKMPVRGVLSDEDGPLAADDLAAMTRFPADIFEAAFAVLTDPKIGWLVHVDAAEAVEALGRSAVEEGKPPDDPRRQGSTDRRQRSTSASLQDKTGQDKTVAQTAAQSACSEPPLPRRSKPPVLPPEASEYPVFPCAGSPRLWPLPQGSIDEWTGAYPAVDVPAECRKAHAWIRSNLDRRKTARGMPAFLNKWMSRTQDKGGSNGVPANGGINGAVNGKHVVIDFDAERRKAKVAEAMRMSDRMVKHD